MSNPDETIRNATAASKREDWPEAIRLWTQVVAQRGGDDAPKKLRTHLWRARQAQNGEDALQRNRLVFKALADTSKPIRINPHLIRGKVRASLDLELYPNAVLPGDWDLDPLVIDETLKHQSMRQHFVGGVAWRETELFKSYAKRIDAGKVVRSRKTIDELLEDYRKIDVLYESMQQRGFSLPDDQRNKPGALPHVHIGRTGEILYGRAGNHRLAIAKILNLEHITCLVHARHAEWQDLRERTYRVAPERRRAELGDGLADHPDLADLIE
jgi:hypothetical protein